MKAIPHPAPGRPAPAPLKQQRPVTRICFVVPRIYSLLDKSLVNQTGGSEKQAYLLARALAKDHDFDVNCLLADFGQKELFEQENIRFYRSFSFNESRIKALIKFYRTLRTIKADIYVFRAPDVGVFAGLFIVKHLLKKKTVYMLASHVELFFNDLRKAAGLCTALTIRFVHKGADRITAQKMQQKQLLEQNTKRKVDALIPNVIENICLPSNPRPRDLVLWVGRCIPLKQAELFLVEAQLYPAEHFVMICPPASDRPYFEKIKSQAAHISNLEFIEYVAPAEMKDYYLRSKLYLITSEAEGFSNTMMEAMMAGAAVISLSLNPDNIFDKYELGLYSNNRIEEFHSNVALLINNDEMQRTVAGNAREYLLNNHVETKIIAEFKKLLLTLRE